MCLSAVRVCGSLLICVPSVSSGHSVPLCAERERRREAHLDMRSQIIYLTLRQEGLNREQEGQNWRRVRKKEGEKQTRKNNEDYKKGRKQE